LINAGAAKRTVLLAAKSTLQLGARPEEVT